MLTKKRRSQKQEKSGSKDFNARPTTASGAKWFQKGDVRNSKFLIECKTTANDSYRVTTKVWEKIKEEAIRDSLRIPLLVVDLKDTYRYVVFNPNDFEAPLPPYECSGEGEKKSYLMKYGFLSSLLAEEVYAYAKLFKICGKHENILAYMRFDDFSEYYRKELE